MTEAVAVEFDIDDFTIGEIADFEEVTGMALGEAFEPGKAITGKSLIAVAWIFGRRKNPDITLEDVRNMKMSELNFGAGKKLPKDRKAPKKSATRSKSR